MAHSACEALVLSEYQKQKKCCVPYGCTFHQGVLVVFDKDRDYRILGWIDLLPEEIKAQLVAAHEHNGGLELDWIADVPKGHEAGTSHDIDVDDGDV